jgi:hypothetical protein
MKRVSFFFILYILLASTCHAAVVLKHGVFFGQCAGYKVVGQFEIWSAELPLLS